MVHWFRPGNRPYEPNRAPPDEDANSIPEDINSPRQRELVPD
ncbi:MAG: hypothetical protein ACRDJL_03875 [Actinomycetota bacterium]